MRGIRERVNKLYSRSISDVSSEIAIYKDDKQIKKASFGTNKQKVVRIVVRL